MAQARRDLVDRRTQLLNQLTALLKTYYPQALELVGNLNTELAADFLSRWPDLLTLKAARPGVLKRFYYAHNLRRPQLLEQRLDFVRRAVALTTNPVTLQVAVLQLHCLLDQWRVFHRHIPRLDAQIKQAFRQHPEVDLFRNLPGAGPALGPRLCAAFGTIRIASIPIPPASKNWLAWPRCGKKAATNFGPIGAGRPRASCARPLWNGPAKPSFIALGPGPITNT